MIKTVFIGMIYRERYWQYCFNAFDTIGRTHEECLNRLLESRREQLNTGYPDDDGVCFIIEEHDVENNTTISSKAFSFDGTEYEEHDRPD